MAKAPKPIPQAEQKAPAIPAEQSKPESEATTEDVASDTQTPPQGSEIPEGQKPAEEDQPAQDKAPAEPPASPSPEESDDRPFDGETPDGSDASPDASEEEPEDLRRVRFKSERYPYRRGGLIFGAARQWDEHTRESFEAATTTTGREAAQSFEALVHDPVVVVQVSEDGGKTWTTMSPPAPGADDDED